MTDDHVRNPPLDRRRFLSIAGAGVAGPLLAGCSAPGPTRPKIPPSEQITLGIIGPGVRLRRMVQRQVLKDERVRVLAVCEVDGKRRAQAKEMVDKRYGNKDCKEYVDYRELLERGDIDAVMIGTPDHWHATQSIHAAQAKKDIYCEKPLTHTLEEGRRIVAAVNKHRRVFQTGSQQRTEFGHKFCYAVEYVRNGRIGDIITAHVGVGDAPFACDLGAEKPEPGLDWDRWLGPAPKRDYSSVLSPRGVHNHYPKWRSYWEYSGGYLADMGAHHFDIVQWALDQDDGGPIEALPPHDPKANRGARVRYANGVTVVHGGPSGSTFIGTKGMIHIDRGRSVATPDRIFKKPIGDDGLHVPRHKNHFDNWIECIKSRETPICSAEIGARSAAVCQLLNLAYRHRRKISWDPVAWMFTGDEPQEWMDYRRRSGYELAEV